MCAVKRVLWFVRRTTTERLVFPVIDKKVSFYCDVSQSSAWITDESEIGIFDILLGHAQGDQK